MQRGGTGKRKDVAEKARQDTSKPMNGVCYEERDDRDNAATTTTRLFRATGRIWSAFGESTQNPGLVRRGGIPIGKRRTLCASPNRVAFKELHTERRDRITDRRERKEERMAFIACCL